MVFVINYVCSPVGGKTTWDALCYSPVLWIPGPVQVHTQRWVSLWIIIRGWNLSFCCFFISPSLAPAQCPPWGNTPGNPKNVFFFFFFFNKSIYLFIYFWLCWVFVAVHGLSLVATSGGYSSLRCAGFSLWWLLLMQSTGSRGAWAQ